MLTSFMTASLLGGNIFFTT